MKKIAQLPFQDPALSFEIRVQDLISRMKLKEKVAQMCYKAPRIKRLNIPPYDWWNECLHGVGRAGIATVFPQAIGLAATFDPTLIFQIATAISDEARAKHHEAVRLGDYGRYKGLTFWSPNVNLFRDPRWGRGQETYGEDPYLTGRMGVAFVKGLQGNHPKYLKLIATPKHYAVHSGLEKERHFFNAITTPKDLRESYLPHFKETVIEGHAQSIMCAYNRTNNELCCASPTLLQKILREEWGFNGYVVSDCGAIANFHLTHRITRSPWESAALAVNNGCDLDCGMVFRNLERAVKKKLITEAQIDQALTRLMLARFKLGMFDPPDIVPYAQIPLSINDCDEHRHLAFKAAQASIVLLKNQRNYLPLKQNAKKIAVIGPNANDAEVLLGNYNGTPSKSFTPLEGIKNWIFQKNTSGVVLYAKGCEINGGEGLIDDAVNVAKQGEVVILCLGISQKLEGEEHLLKSDDRKDLGLPPVQQKLLERIIDTGTPIVLVLINGSPVCIPEVSTNNAVQAILEAWYPGEEGGNALASILFGEYSPAGRLPITFVHSVDDLPPIRDYTMNGRTYRYLTKSPLYPFGYGSSYTLFDYKNLNLDKNQISVGDSVKISVDVQNIGNYSGDEVIQLYLKDLEASVPVPHHALCGLQRITFHPKESKTVEFNLDARHMTLINKEGRCILEPGEFQIFIGGHQPDLRSCELLDSLILTTNINLTGSPLELKF